MARGYSMLLTCRLVVAIVEDVAGCGEPKETISLPSGVWKPLGGMV